ncbi:14168_t:CDS:2, partial [Gigaspora rosea]
MSIQENYSKTTNKGKRKAQYCNLEGHDDVICNYDQYSASIVTDQLTTQLTTTCTHSKHSTYLATARKGEATKFGKTPERLTRFFQLPKGAKMCHHCLYKTDIDP